LPTPPHSIAWSNIYAKLRLSGKAARAAAAASFREQQGSTARPAR
jgi:hypothetical protein